MSKQKLLISFSGGATSGYMTYTLLKEYADQYEMIVVFANTGEENEATLKFVDDCDKNMGFGVVWVEADVKYGVRKSSGHKVVNYETASRSGEPYEDHIVKYGIPNMKFPHCTRELKRNPIEDYAESLGWGTDYFTAIGIRTDEIRRVKPQGARKIIYPLVDLFPSDKQDVQSFWEDQEFRLQLKEHEGNCKWCWKKSDSKLMRLMTEAPIIFEFPDRMEKKYPRVGPEFVKDPTARDRTFFRQNRSVEDLRRLHAQIGGQVLKERPEENSGCSESCELYETEEK